MTHFMAYVILLSAGVSVTALLLELLARGRTATRWLWVVSLGTVVAIAGAVTFAPLPGVEEQPLPTASPVSLPPAASPLQETVVGPSRTTALLRIADTVLPAAWVTASIFLLLAILYGQRRLTRERRASQSKTLNGHEVLLTETSGPAVAGVGKPVVLLPRWVMALDTPSRELLLAHEFEHVKQGDTRLLLTGAVVTALMPWNPVVWWIDRRLRLAVEKDCDARVLRQHPDVRRYADLLLMAAGRPGVTTRLLAAHFGEHRSDLDRRIRAMTERTLRWRPTLAAAAIAGLLIVASCEAPRPEPLAPRDGEKATTPNVITDDAVYFEFQVEKPVTQAAGSARPKYPDILRQAGVEGKVLVSFVVNEDGTADPASFKVIRTTHELFATAVKGALPAMRFVAAEVGGKKVKQLVQQPFTFSIVGGKSETTSPANTNSPEMNITGVSGGPNVVLRSNRDVPGAPVNVVVYAFDGHELGRGQELFQKVDPQAIESIEVYKPRTCPGDMTCPLIKITLKRGKTLGSQEVRRPLREEAAWEPKKSGTDRQRQLDSIMSAPMTVELLTSAGKLLARHRTRAEFTKATSINSEDISRSETYSGKSCSTGVVSCPLTRIWLKPGREITYMKS